jgi:hypothetical protein
MTEAINSKQSLRELVREAIDYMGSWEYDDIRGWCQRAEDAISADETQPVASNHQCCTWIRMPDIQDPREALPVRYYMMCAGEVAKGARPIVPDLCYLHRKPLRTTSFAAEAPVAWLVKLDDGWRYLGSTKEDAERTQCEKGGVIVPLYESLRDETTPRRCHCGKFEMHPDMALITDSHAHDHVFDGTPCDCEGEATCSAVEPSDA